MLARPVRKTGWGQTGGVGSQALRFWLLLLSDSASPHSSPHETSAETLAAAGAKAQPGPATHLVQSCGDITSSFAGRGTFHDDRQSPQAFHAVVRTVWRGAPME